MYTCFFIGHRDAPSALQEKLDEAVEYLWRMCGVTQFVVGHHGNFDAMAVSAVNKAKLRHPEIDAYLLLETYTPHSNIYICRTISIISTCLKELSWSLPAMPLKKPTA